MFLEPGQPCPLCSVRPDVECPHRPADPKWSMGKPPPETDTRRSPKPRSIGGGSYRTPRRLIEKRTSKG